MSSLIDIATVVPEYSVTKDELLKFYSASIHSEGGNSFDRKLNIIASKTKIQKRHSCIPDFKLEQRELFINFNQIPSVEKRMEIFKEKAVPLATKAAYKLFDQTGTKSSDYTHLITVTCTGVIAPGLELLIANEIGLQNTEKIGFNYLGCYAALKALKHADYIAKADPDACILIVCVELCSLHFMSSTTDEDVLANLLFADGCAAALVCGNKSKVRKDKISLSIDKIGSSFVPSTMDQMTWNVSQTAFRMYLSKEIVNSIKSNIEAVVDQFLSGKKVEVNKWAIHPGGVRIVEGVQESLGISNSDVEDSLHILEQFGNMSSPTILFILERIFAKLKSTGSIDGEKIFACAFGPGLNIEMILFSIENLIDEQFFDNVEIHALQK